ncbi:hypothetical protein DPMN_180241 [Dreissena polymorpha]|uniref:Uncharacterized protein n=1 Tax=Dreissena polymorpha TaxID=45954 RepID=A0A9D4EIM9_DREPO|nr:hypothetical protein DPMN_180241 [Dreissena polymorpha]
MTFPRTGKPCKQTHSLPQDFPPCDRRESKTIEQGRRSSAPTYFCHRRSMKPDFGRRESLPVVSGRRKSVQYPLVDSPGRQRSLNVPVVNYVSPECLTFQTRSVWHLYF